MVISLFMFDELERSKVKVTNLIALLTLKRFILDTKFVLVTDRKSYGLSNGAITFDVG